MAADKVRCAVCKYQVNAFCGIKKSKVALNKRRNCDKFKIEPGRVRLKEQLPTTRGIHHSLRKDAKADFKRRIKEDRLRKQFRDSNVSVSTPHIGPSYSEILNADDEKYPKTGDLSRFTSSAEKE